MENVETSAQSDKVIQINIKRGFNSVFKCSCGCDSFKESNGIDLLFICTNCGNVYIETK